MEPSAHKLWCNDEMACAYVTYVEPPSASLHCIDVELAIIWCALSVPSSISYRFFSPFHSIHSSLLCVLIEFIAPIVAVVNMRIILASLISMITAHRFGLSGGIINIHPISHFHSLARSTTRRQFSTCFPMSGKLKVDTNYTLDAMMSELSPGT